MWLLECHIVKEKELSTALYHNATFAQIITHEKINLIVTLKIALVFQAVYNFNTQSLLMFDENLKE